MSANYGDYPVNHTAVCMDFDSFAAATGAPSATSNFANTDIQIYKDGGTTQRSSANGITVSTSFDGNTGLQMVVIDLSDNTDAGFYAAGHEYNVAVADVTIDSQTVRFWLGSFSIERAGGVLAILKSGAAKTTLADGVAHGGTLGSSTATLALSRLSVVSQSANTAAVTATGNGTGSGIVATSGAGATGDGIQATAGSTNGNGVVATATGSGNALKLSSVSGDALLATVATSGHGATFAGTGTTKHGINATGGATTSHGINAIGGGVGHGILATSGSGATGDGIRGTSAATNGNGLNLVGNGTGNGLLSTGGAGAGGDGIEAAAGGGVDIRGAITGNVTGNLSGSVGSVTGAVGSVTGAVGSVTGAVGSVTGNVGGNVVGSVGSLTVNNDKTGYAIGTGGIAAASFAAGAIDAAAIAADAIGSSEFAAAAVTKIWANACTEPASVVAASPTAIAALSWLLTLSRNLITQTATTQTLKADDGTTTIATATVSDDGVTFSRSEWA